jgi:tripartite-type tricarboxylate transporter receptor subunit TctC
MNPFRIFIAGPMSAFLLQSAITALLAAAVAVPALAQYPIKPIRLVVAFPPGPVDSKARIVARGLTQSLGQPVVIDNRPGADGAIGAEAVIKSPPDGYVLLFSTNTAMLAPATFRAKPPYDPLTAFTPISLVGRGTFFLYIHPDMPATTLAQFVAHAKLNPGKLNNAAANSTATLASAQLLRAAGMDLAHVPFKGEGTAIIELLSGRVQMMFASDTSLLAQAKDGKVRVLATLTATRSALAPDVPTFAEQGFGSVSVSPWTAVFGPPQMPENVVARLTRDLNAFLRTPEAIDQLARQGTVAEGSSPAELGTFVKDQLAAWARAAQDAGIKPE